MMETIKIGNLTELSLEVLEAFFPSEASMPAKPLTEKPEDVLEIEGKRLFTT